MTAGVDKYLQAVNGDGIATIGGSGNDTLIAGNGTQQLWGTAGNDLLIAGTGNQAIYGGSGNDYIVAGYGNQTLDGGSGIDTLDFSRLNGHLSIDQDLHTATLTDPVTGAVLYTYTVTSFNAVVGTNAGTDFHAQANTSNTYTGGAGSDHYFSESGGDTVTGGGGADIFGWMKKYVAVGHVDTITDFTVGQDKLDLSDFLKGQTLSNPSYSDVVRLSDSVDASGNHSAIVQALVGTTWHDMARLSGIDIANVGPDHHALTLSEIILT